MVCSTFSLPSKISGQCGSAPLAMPSVMPCITPWYLPMRVGSASACHTGHGISPLVAASIIAQQPGLARRNITTPGMTAAQRMIRRIDCMVFRKRMCTMVGSRLLWAETFHTAGPHVRTYRQQGAAFSHRCVRLLFGAMIAI